jgi:hypothetical protein
MKKLFFLGLLIINTPGFCQKDKLYATVFDEDNNPIARGLFKSAADSGVIILVDDMEIFVNATEITILKIEKNPSTSEFLKLGTTAATEVASYLINKPKKQQDTFSTDSIPLETPVIATETKDELFQRINKLVENLINGKNDLATMNINNSAEKFLSKLRLLQEYSMDKEIVAWNDYSQNQQPTNEINNPQQDSLIQDTVPTDQTTQTEQNGQTDQATQTASSSTPVMTTVVVPVHSKTFTLSKGLLFVNPKPAAVTTISSKPVKDIKQASSNKNVITGPTVVKHDAPIPAKDNKEVTANKTLIKTTTAKPAATASTKINNQISINKNLIIVPASKTNEKKQTTVKIQKSSISTIQVKK